MILKDQEGNWIFTYKSGDKVVLDPSLFEPVEGETINGIPCITVRPATHYALLTSRSLRPKDERARQLLKEVLSQEDKELLKSDVCKNFMSMLYMY